VKVCLGSVRLELRRRRAITAAGRLTRGGNPQEILVRAALESRAKARCASGCQGETTEAVCKGWGGVVRCGRGRAAALLWRQWRLWRVRVRGGDSVGDGTPGATRVVKKASRRSRRVGQQGKLAGDLGEMDAGAARSGWRGRKGTLTGWGRRVSGSGENGARGLGCEGDWTGAGWAGAGRGAGPCASGPGEKGRWAAGVRVAAVRERWERALRDWAKRGDVERR